MLRNVLSRGFELQTQKIKQVSPENTHTVQTTNQYIGTISRILLANLRKKSNVRDASNYRELQRHQLEQIGIDVSSIDELLNGRWEHFFLRKSRLGFRSHFRATKSYLDRYIQRQTQSIRCFRLKRLTEGVVDHERRGGDVSVCFGSTGLASLPNGSTSS